MSRHFALRFMIEVTRDLAQRAGDLRVARRCGSGTQMHRARAKIIHVMHFVDVHIWLRCGMPVRHDGRTPQWWRELPAPPDFGVILNDIGKASVYASKCLHADRRSIYNGATLLHHAQSAQRGRRAQHEQGMQASKEKQQ